MSVCDTSCSVLPNQGPNVQRSVKSFLKLVVNLFKLGQAFSFESAIPRLQAPEDKTELYNYKQPYLLSDSNIKLMVLRQFGLEQLFFFALYQMVSRPNIEEVSCSRQVKVELRNWQD